ncbi:MAG: PilZ domain-containing protein [Treponema sp.]|nr:PilZ domain-containing protein [Treponema sp.]
MKLLLVLGCDDNFKAISDSMQPLGFEIVRYRHVLKAMDNIDEVAPSAVIVSARDFPGHWKILVQFIRSERSKESCPVIVLKGPGFGTEETSKAFFLGVNGVLEDSLDAPEKLDRLQNIMGRYVPVNEKRRGIRYSIEPWHRIGFLISDFPGRQLVSGLVRNISGGGLSFFPINSDAPDKESLQAEFSECSLRVGDAILSPVCRLVRTGTIVSMEFVRFPRGEQHILDQYIDEFPLLEYGYVERAS